MVARLVLLVLGVMLKLGDIRIISQLRLVDSGGSRVEMAAEVVAAAVDLPGARSVLEVQVLEVEVQEEAVVFTDGQQKT